MADTTNIKKEQEREELHRAIWAIADELRGSVVLTYKFVDMLVTVGKQSYQIGRGARGEPEVVHPF